MVDILIKASLGGRVDAALRFAPCARSEVRTQFVLLQTISHFEIRECRVVPQPLVQAHSKVGTQQLPLETPVLQGVTP